MPSSQTLKEASDFSHTLVSDSREQGAANKTLQLSGRQDIVVDNARVDDALTRSSRVSAETQAPMPDSSAAGPRPPSDATRPGPKALGRSVTFRESIEITPFSQSASPGRKDLLGNHVALPHTVALKGRGAGLESEPGGLEAADMAGADTQRQLHRYRESLARDIEKREFSTKGRSPPVASSALGADQLESSLSPTAPSEPTSTSTDSANTVRGGDTPGLHSATSYAFPRMTPSTFSTHAFSDPSLSGRHFFENYRLQSRPPTHSSMPSSTMPFSGGPYPQLGVQPEYPTPDISDLTLMLCAEPGLEAWWSSVVQIMTQVFRAERVTLAVPADSTDIENVPWGQKASYNLHQDDFSVAYLERNSSFMPSSNGDVSDARLQAEDSARRDGGRRPSLQSRHSFTTYENEKDNLEGKRLSGQRPGTLPRSKSSYHPTSVQGMPPGRDVDRGADQVTELNKTALDTHDAIEEQHPISPWETTFAPVSSGRGKVLNVLQALDYEADPLIDHNGVLRVLERGRVITLTRNYPYLGSATMDDKPREENSPPHGKSPESARKRTQRSRSESTSNLLPLFGNTRPASSGRGTNSTQTKKVAGMSKIEDEHPRPPTPNFEEFEQAPPSPWSQSPAPSPAVRPDAPENPFFTDAVVDEESFNPSSTPQDYSSMVPPEAIGVDNSWTVLHVPLAHVLLSKISSGFRLDDALLEQKIARGKAEGGGAEPEGVAAAAGISHPPSSTTQKHAPIGIISILSPIIPYPANLRHSLGQLAPHLATSFSLARHYTNLEAELNGLQKRRTAHNVGFGAVGHDGRPLTGPVALSSLGYFASEDALSRGSLAGSITSPSDYSGPSRSVVASPAETPSWDPSALGFSADKRPFTSSPAPVGGDCYFSADPQSGMASIGQQMSKDPRGSAGVDRKPSLRRASGKPQLHHEAGVSGTAVSEGPVASNVSSSVRSDEGPSAALQQPQRRSPSFTDLKDQPGVEDEKMPAAATRSHAGNPPRRPADLTPHSGRHTQLHSYGADFASTFQSLTPSSIISKSNMSQASALSRTGSVSAAHVGMTPPSDRLKGLILDSLPAHVFVALPQTGEIVWVNSRFLTYRGQTSGQLADDPWGSIHPDDRDEYLRAWSHCVRTGEQFSRTVRIRRFDGAYRWFYARAVASKDRRGVILQFLGSYMDIHDQHIAELRAARQEEVEVSEAKHRLLANLIPQIIFTATEDEGITFANEQWLSYTGQTFDDALGLGFMDYVHPEDLAKCRIPTDRPPTPLHRNEQYPHEHAPTPSKLAAVPMSSNIRGVHQALSRNNSSSSSSVYELPIAHLSELAKQGIIKVATDSNGRLSYTTEIRLRSKAGEYRWHLVRCVEIDTIDFGSGASSYFGSATDINDHKLLEAKLKEAMESKGRFLSNMSHEIRTPLVGISGMVSFLQDTTLNEEQRDYTNTIQTSANSLLMIINDILDLSKVDAGMMKLSHEWFHTRSLIEDVNELVSTMAIAKRLELNYIIEPNVPPWVKGDRVRIRQVLLNVIGNAIKFTAQGEVFSRCKVLTAPADVKLEANEVMLEFSVTDTGRGFTDEEAELIFKPFSQIDGSSTRQHGGSGLGLVISRQLVELHGGTMAGTAVLGKGSTFTFTARFGLPTGSDRPDAPVTSPGELAPQTHEEVPQVFKKFPNIKHGRPSPAASASATDPEATDPEFVSPTLVSSSGSEPSVNSYRTDNTDGSSVSSVNVGLVRFSAAARASGQDLSQMKLEMPPERSSPTAGIAEDAARQAGSPSGPRPPMYSILLICPQTHSREATTSHIEMTLPKDIPHQITALSSIQEAEGLVTGEDAVIFTHIVANLPTTEQIVRLMDRITESGMVGKTKIIILSDSVQRQALTKQVANTKHERLLSEGVSYVYKPVKPSRFAVIFDPNKQQDLSIDRNRSIAQRVVEDQKQSYLEVERRMGNKGYKVLVVEDNAVNQKVLQKYLKKVGVEVELAVDGVECTEKVLSRQHGYYSLVLCDLHMPRKDGYQACREIRNWEASNGYPDMPIIALSANVMSDVQEKCVAAGFSDYVTKPVDFIELSTALSKFFHGPGG